MESISIKQLYGVAKLLGSVLSVSGALVFAFAKGPSIKFMKWYPENQKLQVSSDSQINDHHIVHESLKGSLIMLSANSAWSLWLILQVFSPSI